ncbi:PREDICTED: uncharacterized protein LOC104806496 [Tarenaya hassleriana]|uniref:uncharacterized protein LOC104806496 n=1 Tax=Tarenaya hassleriana TaxID=28532 RepID=UPI00053C1474|nr:PREDICTED: uncharacterized protein LOC104806496 [Tarenaya hassleriana]
MRFSSSRPVSSPGRVENYPPLLMRFLRTNTGCKSRGRSRSSPIFFRRKNTPATETQEPSSPKVTCMGQVRMTRSKKSKPRPGRVAGKSRQRRRRRCWWVKSAFSCHPSAGKLKPNFFSPVWRKWVSFSRVSFSGKSEKRSSSTRSEPIFRRSTVQLNDAETRTDEQEEEEENSSKSFDSIPPRNALLLTRCRSAPYRSSSLASRFWGSPVSRDQQEQSQSETEQVQTRQKQPEDSNAAPEKMSDSGESSTSVEEPEKSEDSVGESERKSGNNGAEKTEHCGSPRQRLSLTRCKSEPARMGERLVPELGFWKNTRLGFT